MDGKGWAVDNLGNASDALKLFNKAIDLNPKEPSYWSAKADVLAKLGNNTESLKAYDQAIALNPKDPSAWMAKGWASV